MAGCFFTKNVLMGILLRYLVIFYKNYEIRKKVPLDIKRIVITGGPSSGKTSIINSLEKRGEFCFKEIAREVVAQFQKQGILKPFLTDPLNFSRQILLGQIKQFKAVEKFITKLNNNRVFYDRGIHDVIGYMNYGKQDVPLDFNISGKSYVYDKVFILPPWQAIHTQDKERFETFEEASAIFESLKHTYIHYGFLPIEVPLVSVEKRVEFILHNI